MIQPIVQPTMTKRANNWQNIAIDMPLIPSAAGSAVAATGFCGQLVPCPTAAAATSAVPSANEWDAMRCDE